MFPPNYKFERNTPQKTKRHRGPKPLIKFPKIQPHPYYSNQSITRLLLFPISFSSMETDDPLPITASKRPPPNFITLSPFPPLASPSPRRLSSCFMEPNRPVRATRQLAWVSLQGRLVGAEEASSAKTIAGENGSFLSPQEVLSWELFTPIHRILIVAVIAVAAANSMRSKEVFRLKRAVELRDQVLLRMQEQLDNLCEQFNYVKDQPEAAINKYDCQLCLKHKDRPTDVVGNSAVKTCNGDEVLMFRMPAAREAEPEERRMSDLSDWGSSIASSLDFQFNTLAFDQDIYNLRRECEEKDATIKELSTFIRSSEVFGSKRIGELEDVIRRKSMIITKLKKDILVLEQKVINLTRSHRLSFSTAKPNENQLPAMADNLLFYMDSSTSPSSSDSDSTTINQPKVLSAKSREVPLRGGENSLRLKKLGQFKGRSDKLNPVNNLQKPQSLSPLKEKSLNQMNNTDYNPRRIVTSSSSGQPKSGRRALPRPRDVCIQKRWV